MTENIECHEFKIDEYQEPEGYYYVNGETALNPDLEKGFRYADILNGKLVWIYEPFTEERVQQLKQEQDSATIDDIMSAVLELGNIIASMQEGK